MKAFVGILSVGSLTLGLIACDGRPGHPSAAGPGGVSSGILWGGDDRTEVSADENDPMLRAQMQAVVALIPNANIDKKSNKTFTFRKQLLHQFQNFCPEVKFLKDEVLSRCSGILIGEDRILTAGHCVKNSKECESQVYAFGYYDKRQREFPAKDIYQCKKVILNAESPEMQGFDLAVVQLDRPVKDRIPYEIGSVLFEEAESLRIIGTSQGLALKKQESNVYWKQNEVVVYADSDTFGGDSGAPVFSVKTGALKGILLAGAEDFVMDEERQCLKPYVCNEETCSGEQVMHIQEAAKALGIPNLFTR